MKLNFKRLAICLAVVAVATVGTLVLTSNRGNAQINPECPNGCKANGNGCYCLKNYPDLREAKWKDDVVVVNAPGGK